MTDVVSGRLDGMGASPGRVAGTGDGDVPPHLVLMDLAVGMYVPRCLQVVAAWGVADAVPTEGADIELVAATVDVDAGALLRMLRALAARGVFELDGRWVGHTEASQLLRRDHPMSLGAFPHMNGLPFNMDSIVHMADVGRTGRAWLDKDGPGGWVSYLDGHPDEREVFDRAMTAKAAADVGSVLEAYDFGHHRTIADIGGGVGHLLSAVAGRHPIAELVLVDLPDVIARVVAEQGPDSRLVLHGADFFVDRLPSADLYVLMDVLHDWDDEEAVRILAAIRAAAPADAVVLIAETVMPESAGPDIAKVIDLIMLTVTGGRERTPTEFATLARRAGYELQSVKPTNGGMTLVEFRTAALAGGPGSSGTMRNHRAE